jgi:hypothetical protein
MNKIKTLSLIIAFAMISVVSNAQFHVGGEAGFSTKTAIVGGFSLGYDFKIVNIEAGMLSHLSQAVDKPTIFNVKLGHSILIRDETILQPSIGYAYNMRSNDMKSLNTSSVIYSLYYIKDWKYNADWYLGINYTSKILMGTIGLRLNLNE